MIAVLCDELKDYFSLSLVMKIKSKLKLQKLTPPPPKTPFPQGGWKARACSPTDFIKELAQKFKGSDLWPFIRGVTSLYNVLQMFIEEKGCPWGFRMLQIRPKQTKIPLICSSTSTKQQTNNDKRCPKTLWKCLGLLVGKL